MSDSFGQLWDKYKDNPDLKRISREIVKDTGNYSCFVIFDCFIEFLIEENQRLISDERHSQ